MVVTQAYRNGMSDEQLLKLSWLRRACQTGEAIEIRQAAGLSGGEVAGSVGVDPATVWRWEHGKRSPRGEAALSYASALLALREQTRTAA